MAKRRDRLAGELGSFVKHYARKKHPRHDPNDRRYDRDVERELKRIDPRELGLLLRGESLEDE